VKAHLLDSNVLIALAVRDHEHHARVAGWVATIDVIALCPVVEGALVRFLLRLGVNIVTARNLLLELHASPRSQFWKDSLSYTEADLSHVVGHRQVTDAYLAALAAKRGGLLATLDQGLAEAAPDRVLLVPSA
jgi:toxin-antitoxin system PIN domain toxin